MKRFLISLLFVFLGTQLSAQKQVEAQKLVGEGVALHDKGDFTGAIALYDKALEIDKDNILALSEKALSLLAAKKYSESIEVCKQTLEKHRGDDHLGSLYVTYGNALDDSNQIEESLRIYDEGIKLFPEYYMLHFNKGITLSKAKRDNEALTCIEKSLAINPYHAGSHNLMGIIQKNTNHNIPMALAIARFLVLEPQGQRAKDNLAKLLEIMSAHVEKKGENTINITLSPVMAKNKPLDEKQEPNNFNAVELLLAMAAATDYEDKNANKSKVELFINKFDHLCSALKESRATGSGFFWEYYAPYFIDMQQQKLVETFGHIAFISSNDPAVFDWLKSHQKEIDQFVEWEKSYKWNSNI